MTISPAGLQHKKLSCNITLLSRCTTTETRWKRKWTSRSSPDDMEIHLLTSLSRSRADSFSGPLSHLQSIRTRTNWVVRSVYLAVFRVAAISAAAPASRADASTPWVKKNMSPYFCPYLRHMWTDFKNSFTDTLCGKFAMKWLLIGPPHLNCVATLPCEMLM